MSESHNNNNNNNDDLNTASSRSVKKSENQTNLPKDRHSVSKR